MTTWRMEVHSTGQAPYGCESLVGWNVRAVGQALASCDLWTYNLDNLGTSRAPIPRYFTGYSPSHFKGHISLWKYHCWLSCGVMPGYTTWFLGNVTALLVRSRSHISPSRWQLGVGWSSARWINSLSLAGAACPGLIHGWSFLHRECMACQVMCSATSYLTFEYFWTMLSQPSWKHGFQ